MPHATRTSSGPQRSHARVVEILGVLLALALAWAPTPARAGCGCDKPPPRAAQVRPQVTYAGMPVTLFSPALAAGGSYDVTFKSMDGTTATVRGEAAQLRDLADAAQKAQLTVTLPGLPLGPAGITVKAVGATAPALTIADRIFTVAPDPIALPSTYGTWSYPDSRAAVDRDGVVYLSLDLTGMKEPLVFEADLVGYPLRFTEKDVVFLNAQGFLMQLLVQADGQTIPGMFAFPASNPAKTSDLLHYSRHEFNTYFLQHFERHPHALDPTDGDWHVDGTRHIDHDHLIVSIVGRLGDGTLPAPGATPAFDLRLRAFSLFYQGLVGASSITMTDFSSTSGFDPATGRSDANGDVFTNGQLKMSNWARIRGDATAASFRVAYSSYVSGKRIRLASPSTFMPIKVPSGLPALGTISLSGYSSRKTLAGPGSFQVDKIALDSGSRLFVDNAKGPVTLYVTGDVTIAGGSDITVADPNPEKFAIYMAAEGSKVSVTGNGTTFYGVVYGPTVPIEIGGDGEFSGAFIGKKMTLSGTADVRYDTTLRETPDDPSAQSGWRGWYGWYGH